MPLFEYQCLECGKKSETLKRYDDPPPAACPHCGGKLKKLVSSPAFQFKGTGWYVTDYAGRKGGDEAKGDTGSEAKAEAKGEGKTESKDAAGDAKADKPAAKPAEESGGAAAKKSAAGKKSE
jgi:putative FmdB family regulatory protein